MTIQRWLRFCFLNLLLVAGLGVLLRYKIAFSLPIVDQKNVLHSHSHFAFTGWITQALFVLLVHYLLLQNKAGAFKKYKYLLATNMLAAYGMLVSFILQGYGLYSISFSTLSILVAFIFSYQYWKDLRDINGTGITHHWLKAALIFNVISAAGAFTLAFVMALKLSSQKIYLASVYYFLHFQYNGWFFFACMGLFFYAAKCFNHKRAKIIFWLFAISCVPAYFLSVLWAAIHPLLYLLVVVAAAAQTIAWGLFIHLLLSEKKQVVLAFGKTAGRLLLLSAIACSIKLLLQLGSVVPYLSDLAFSFRPIVIGYLHLVLLGVISLFLLGYMVSAQLVNVTALTAAGIVVFVCGIFFNELLLMVQGVAAITGTWIPYTNESLFGAALLLFTGILIINLSIRSLDGLEV